MRFANTTETADNTSLICIGYSSYYFTFTASVRVHAVAMAVFNAVFSVVATVGNLLVLWAFVKTPSLRNSSNYLLGNLCLTDLFVGCVTQPLCVIKYAQEAADVHHCVLKKISTSFAFTGSSISVIIVAVISIDRCFAISSPYKYQRIVSPSLYTKVLVPIWTVTIFANMLMAFKVIEENTYWVLNSTGFAVAFFVVLVSYAIIFKTVIRQSRSAHLFKLGKFDTTLNTRNKTTNILDPLRDTTRRQPNEIEGFTASPCHTDAEIRSAIDDDIIYKNKLESDGNDAINNPKCSSKNSKGDLKVSHKKTKVGSISKKEIEVACTQNCKEGSRQKGCSPSSFERSRLQSSSYAKSGSKGASTDSNEKRGAITVAIIILTLTICYIPFSITLGFHDLFQENGVVGYLYSSWTSCFIYLNSSLNPIIYCYRNNFIRESVWRKLKCF